MAIIRPFHAVRPPPPLAHLVASVPYDVVTTEEARDLAAGNDWSFLRVVRAEIDLPMDVDLHAAAVYEQAGTVYRRFLEEGVLARDPEPALYLYQQRQGAHVQTGVVGCCSVDEYDRDVIKKHERTRPEKEDDRTRHALAVGAQTGPVFLTYRDTPAVSQLVAEWVERVEPLYHFKASDGVDHTVWRVPSETGLEEAFGGVTALYVADGHHRSASASRARDARRQGNPAHRGDEEYNFFLSVLIPASEVQILPYNRVVHDLGGLEAKELLERLACGLTVTEDPGEPAPESRGCFGMYLAERWYRVEAPRELVQDPDPVASLDAAILQDRILGPILGIDDPRTSERIEFVGGIHGTEELARRVTARPGSVAFSLFPLGVDQLMAVADRGRVLPPKSTWFEPKLRSGLLVHELD